MTSQLRVETKLEKAIEQAIKKLGARKENDICRYIPIQTGGYIHHFTMRKMKSESPEELLQMIEENILNANNPKNVSPRPRAARGSRKLKNNFPFNKQDLDRLLNMARLAGDKELIRKLTPREDLRTIKRKLISSIRHGRIERDLWECYVEVQTADNQIQAQELIHS